MVGAFLAMILALVVPIALPIAGCEKKPEPIAPPTPVLTVGPGLKVYVPNDPVRVSVVALGPDGRATATFAGRISAGDLKFTGPEVKPGGSARLRFDRGGMPGRGDPPVWFKSDGVTEIAAGAGVAEYIYKGATEEVTVEFDGGTIHISPGAPKK